MPRLWRAFATLEAVVGDEACPPEDRAVAAAMVAAGRGAVRVQMPARVATIATIAADAREHPEDRRRAWRELSTEAAEARRGEGLRLGRWAAALALSGGREAVG